MKQLFRKTWAGLQERIVVLPLVYVACALLLSQFTLGLDQSLGEDSLPAILLTTASSASSILSTIAGGLITAVTLLLSLVLVTVQLASSQFSPRTLPNWIGDRTQQRTIGMVLGTAVFCLVVLREIEDGGASSFSPNISVLAAVVLTIVSLVAVVHAVDHLSNGMRVDSVARDLVEDSLAAIDQLEDRLALHDPTAAPATSSGAERPPPGAKTICASESGWIQDIDIESITQLLPDDSTVVIAAATGSFVVRDQPLCWVEHAPAGPALDPTAGADGIDEQVQQSFTIGTSRLVDNDVSFGLLQMSDIAVRALSPGINDPSTAADLVVHMGIVLVRLWECPEAVPQSKLNGVSVRAPVATHGDYLSTAFAQTMRYAKDDYEATAALIRTLLVLDSERIRRSMPGPAEPIESMLTELEEQITASELSEAGQRRLRSLLDADK